MRRVFFSFEYDEDCWRTAQVRNIGVVEGDRRFLDNSWEEVRRKSSDSIKNWINSQLDRCSCVIVLIGSTTYTRKWVLYEIEAAYRKGKPLAGIYIHRLLDRDNAPSEKGLNPFDRVYANDGKPLSSHVECYDPLGYSSTQAYNNIRENIDKIIDRAFLRKAMFRY